MLQRELLFKVSAPFAATLGELDLRALQLGYATLMDEAASGIQARRLDLDEVLLERRATVEHPGAAGRSWTIAVEGLTDLRVLLEVFAQAAGARDTSSGTRLAAAEAQITALHVEVYREIGIPLVDFRDPEVLGLE